MSDLKALAAYRRLCAYPTLMWDHCPEDDIPDLILKIRKLRGAKLRAGCADLATVLRHYADTLDA